jgi:hypothetical protein
MMMNYHVSQQAIANIVAVPDERVQATAADLAYRKLRV